MSRRVLLTGMAGFAGHHIAEHLLQTTDWEIVGLVSFKHRGDSLRCQFDDPDERISVVTHDLTGPISERLADRLGPVDHVIHAAAESHVDRSIEDPRPFVENNAAVTLTMLDYARLVKPSAFVQVSTDEVYGPARPGYRHREWDPVIPSNPYSASKACQEAIAISYWRTYGVPLILTNTMNLFGERQDTEKFVPKVISCVMAGESMPIHGRPGAVGSRFYLHARNHADAIRFLLERGAPSAYPEADRPDRWHVVGEREIDNLTMAQTIAEIIGRPLRYDLVDFHSVRPGHDLRYALDGGKLLATGWQHPVPFEESLRRTVEWTIRHREWLLAAA